MSYFLYSKDNYFFNKLKSKILSRNDCDKWIFINDKDYQPIENQDSETTIIFFLHWNYIIPKRIYQTYQCINLHTSNLPDGKGGSPIQNQIMNEIRFTYVNALRMSDKGLDAGPIYNRQAISLQGSLFDIWNTIVDASFYLISEIIDQCLESVEQIESDENIIYKRRSNNQIPFLDECSLEKVYDFIRMLDADDYPEPYLEIGNYKLSFNRAKFDGDSILADVKIRKIKE